MRLIPDSVSTLSGRTEGPSCERPYNKLLVSNLLSTQKELSNLIYASLINFLEDWNAETSLVPWEIGKSFKSINQIEFQNIIKILVWEGWLSRESRHAHHPAETGSGSSLGRNLKAMIPSNLQSLRFWSDFCFPNNSNFCFMALLALLKWVSGDIDCIIAATE